MTICTNNRECWLGEIKDGRLIPSAFGEKTREFWLQIPHHFEHVSLGDFVIMPNHLHAIVIFPSEGVQLKAPTNLDLENHNYFSKISPHKKTLSIIVRTFKGVLTNWCRKNGFDYFTWQRNYHEHIIRDEEDWTRIRNYIHDNPQKWQQDINHPLLITKNEL
ncbi:MAG: transposase [bacterium]